MSNENPYTEIALREVANGNATIETLKENLELMGDANDQATQQINEGIRVALEILKSK